MTKLRNKADEIKGRIQERVGRLVGDKDLERKGRSAWRRSKLKQAGENVRDAVTR